MSKQPIYSHSPELTLDLMITKPNTFLLLSYIAFKLASSNWRRTKELEENEIPFWKFDLDVPGQRPMLKYHQLKTAFDNLVNFGYIEIRPHPSNGRMKAIKLLVNPFPTNKEE